MSFRFCYGKLPQAMWHPMEWLSIMLFVVYILCTYPTRFPYILHLDSFIKSTLVFNTELEKWHLNGLRHEYEDPCILLHFAQPRNHYEWWDTAKVYVVSDEQEMFTNDHNPFWIILSETQAMKSGRSTIRI